MVGEVKEPVGTECGEDSFRCRVFLGGRGGRTYERREVD